MAKNGRIKAYRIKKATRYLELLLELSGNFCREYGFPEIPEADIYQEPAQTFLQKLQARWRRGNTPTIILESWEGKSDYYLCNLQALQGQASDWDFVEKICREYELPARARLRFLSYRERIAMADDILQSMQEASTIAKQIEQNEDNRAAIEFQRRELEDNPSPKLVSPRRKYNRQIEDLHLQSYELECVHEQLQLCLDKAYLEYRAKLARVYLPDDYDKSRLLYSPEGHYLIGYQPFPFERAFEGGKEQAIAEALKLRRALKADKFRLRQNQFAAVS